MHPDASELWHRPDSKKEAEEQEQIDCTASPGGSQVVSDGASCQTGSLDSAQDNWSEESHAIGSDIHQKPRGRHTQRTSSIGARAENHDPWQGCRGDGSCRAM